MGEKLKIREYYSIGRADYRRLVAGGWLLSLESDPRVSARGATQEEAKAAFELVLSRTEFKER